MWYGKKILYRWLLTRLTKRLCEAKIPSSGDKGKKINCYIIYLNKENEPYFMVNDFNQDTLMGILWNGTKYVNEEKIALSNVENLNLEVFHYYGLFDIKYKNIYNLTWHYITKSKYIKIYFMRMIALMRQYFFNKRKLVTRRRVELLQKILNEKRSLNDGIHIMDLMTMLYTPKWIFHPMREDKEKELQIYLDSFEASGELRRNQNNKYEITGKAIISIEKYEIEERRHKQLVRIQWAITIFTFFLIIVGLIQAGLIELPTILDLTK